jgi:hypothetical protein
MNMWLLSVSLLLCVWLTNGQDSIDILESNVIVHQTITTKDGIQVIHVPAHRHLEEVYLYFDYDNNYQLVKLVNQGRCQLLKLLPGSKPIVLDSMAQQRSPLDANSIDTKKLVLLEESIPLASISHLRKELQEACSNLPTYWVQSIEASEYATRLANYEAFDVNNKHYLPSPLARGGWTCSNQGPQGSLTSCNPACFYQLCDPNPGQWCYYRTDQCALISPTCWQHVSTMPLKCKPCCSDSKAPCGTALPFCGCYGPPGNQIGK